MKKSEKRRLAAREASPAPVCPESCGDEGVVMEEYHTNARLIRTQSGSDLTGGEELIRFEKLVRFGEDFSSFEVYALDGKAYALTDDDVYLLENGAAAEVMDLPELDEDGAFD